VDRPLTLPRHWRRNVGRLVKVTVRGAGDRLAVAPGTGTAGTAPGTGTPGTGPGAGGGPATDRQVTARVVDADEHRVVLDTDAGPTGWAHADLGPGRVQVEFNRLDEIADDDPTDADDDQYDDVEDGDDDEDVEGEER
jgi:ribosome maturation factor RimP